MSFVNYHTHSFVVILGLLILVEETHCISARHTKYALKQAYQVCLEISKDWI